MDMSIINNYIGKRNIPGYSEDNIEIICMECKKGAKTSREYFDNLSSKLSGEPLKWAIEKSFIKFVLVVVQRLNKLSELYNVTVQKAYYNILVKTLPTLQSDKVMQMLIKYTEDFWYCIDNRELNYFQDNTIRNNISKVPDFMHEMLISFTSLIEKEANEGGAVKPEHLESVWTDLAAIVSYCRFYKSIQ